MSNTCTTYLTARVFVSSEGKYQCLKICPTYKEIKYTW